MDKQKIMLLVVIALLPAALTGVYMYGMRSALIILAGIAAALGTDLVLQKLTGQNLGWLNWSSILTGLLLALILPPTVPLWMPVLGVIFAVALGKYAFGVGNNIFNPALIGRAFLVISWPKLMTTWITPDGMTGATPLAGAQAAKMDMFIGNIGGCIGETSALALLLGGIFLIALRIIDWKVPAVYIGAVFISAWIFGQDPVFHILAGGLMIGAFFMATDYVTIPLNPLGRLIFAFGCGIMTVIFRLFSGMPEGVMYSILLMNMAAPLIERLTRPRPFGAR